MRGSIEGTAYVDHAGGGWEAWHYSEGRRWSLGRFADRIDAMKKCRALRFRKVVDITKEQK